MTTVQPSHGPNGTSAHASADLAPSLRARSPDPAAPTGPSGARLPALPTPAALALAHASRRDLERALQRGTTPDLDDLVGWEHRGINCTPAGAPPLARLAGVQKFVKGMFRADDGQVMGYNCPVVQNVLDGRWHLRPSDDAPRRFGFYRITAVDPTSRDNHYLHALLLDYGQGGNRPWDPTRGLRDYLVQVEPGDPTLLLGKAYYALGPARLAVGHFVLERFRRAPARSG